MLPVVILEFPSNLGLKEPSPGHEPGVKKLPEWLRLCGFHAQIDPKEIYRTIPPPYSTTLDESCGVRNADAIIAYAKEQAVVLQRVMKAGSFPLVLGGDCSILIGTAVALKKIGNYGLFFLDGHHDFMGPSLSQTGGAAGMDTAIVTGHGHKKLTDIEGLRPYFREEQVWCAGNREYDERYVAAIGTSKIHYTDLSDLRKQGITKCVNEFLEMVTATNLDGFWIHLDVDVLDDAIMPAVDSRTEGGIGYDELEQILHPLLSSPKAAGIEITILDPELDEDGKYTKQFVERFCGVFNRARGQ